MIAGVPNDAMFLALSVHFGGGIEPGPDGLIEAVTPWVVLRVEPTALDWLENQGWIVIGEVVKLTKFGRYRMNKALEAHYGRKVRLGDGADTRLVARRGGNGPTKPAGPPAR